MSGYRHRKHDHLVEPVYAALQPDCDEAPPELSPKRASSRAGLVWGLLAVAGVLAAVWYGFTR